MRLTVLGCSGTIPGPDSPSSSYLVEHDGVRLVLDLGHGALGPLQRLLRPEDIDALVLSHLHPDHCLDVTALATYLRWGPGAPHPKLRLIGPPGSRDRLEAAYAPDRRPVDLGAIFDFAEPRDQELGPFRLTFARVRHPVPCWAVRVEAGGRSLVYSGDTGPSPELVALAAGVDVLLCEASFTPNDPVIPDLHLTARQAGEHAHAAGVRRLIVTHVPPWASRTEAVAAAAEVCSAPVVAATPMSIYQI